MIRCSDREREAVAITAALLKQGRTLHISAMALIVLIGATALTQATMFALAATTFAFVLFAIETYLAVRVGLDAELFARLAEKIDRGELNLEALDQGLTATGLAQKPQSVRGLEERAAGARRLFKRQGAVLLLIFGTAACSAASKWVIG